MALQNLVFDSVSRPITIKTQSGSSEVVGTSKLSAPVAMHVSWDATEGLYAVTHTLTGLAFRRGLSLANATALFQAIVTANNAGTINLQWSDPSAMPSATRTFLLNLLSSYPDQVTGSGSSEDDPIPVDDLAKVQVVPVDWTALRTSPTTLRKVVVFNPTSAPLTFSLRSDGLSVEPSPVEVVVFNEFEVQANAVFTFESDGVFDGLSWKASEEGLVGYVVAE